MHQIKQMSENVDKVSLSCKMEPCQTMTVLQERYELLELLRRGRKHHILREGSPHTGKGRPKANQKWNPRRRSTLVEKRNVTAATTELPPLPRFMTPLSTSKRWSHTGMLCNNISTVKRSLLNSIANGTHNREF